MPEQKRRARAAAPQPRKKRRPHRRDEILGAAVRLFHEKGYHSTGMDDIGAAAGITGPAIYRHFKSKEDLLETLMSERSHAALERAGEIVAEAEAPADALNGLVRLYVETLLDNPALAFVGLYERRTLRGETRAAIERVERLHAETWVAALRQVRPELSEAEARVMVSAANGLAVMAATFKSGLEREVLLPLIVDMMTTALMVDRPRRVRKARAATA